jgi:hypothetical protein
VCVMESWFVMLMVVPAVTERLAGKYWKLEMMMLFGPGIGVAELQPPTSATLLSAARTRRMRIGFRGGLSFVSKDTALGQRCKRAAWLVDSTSKQAKPCGERPTE